MSQPAERGEIEVVIPVERPPTRAERRELLKLGFTEARRLVARHGGQVLGLSSYARGVSLAGDLAMKLRFAVLAPEKVFAWPTAIAVDREIGRNR